MNEIKHTPGPWSFDPNGGLPVIQMYCADNKHVFHGSRSDEEQIANALLCCAAPDLLEALKASCEHMEWSTPQGHGAYADAQAAIEKATRSQS